MLDSVPDPSGRRRHSVRRGGAGAASRRRRATSARPPIRLPLRAARAPSLLEERRVALRGVETWVTVGHFGPVKLAGGELEIVELLLERLFRG